MQAKFLYRYFLIILQSLFLSFLFANCSSSLQKHSIVEPVISVLPEPVENIPGEVADTVNLPVSNDSIIINPIDKLLDDAAAFCREEQFEDADTLLRKAIDLISESSSSFESKDVSSSDIYMERIVFLYSEMIPDSIAYPDEVMQMLFHAEMLQSLDSIVFSGKDSLLVAGLINSGAVEYNVPVVWNQRVQNALVRYLKRNKSTIERWRERSQPYLSFMKKMFADSALPTDLAYLPLIESGFNPKAYSRAHASGIWQFIRSTGKKYGLRNNYWLDERRDPVLSTAAAIRYLQKLYNDFGHWHLALAAYNCGEGGLARAIRRADTTDYWQLKLPRETMNYVPLYLAALSIAKNSGFSDAGSPGNDTVPFDTVSVSECMDMKDIAEGIGILPDTIRKLNPHILRWCTPPDMSNVRLYLPAGYAAAFYRYVEELPDEKRVKWYRYRIRSGDNLGSIADHFRIPIEGIRSVNRLRGTRIIAGKHLFIPIPVGNPSYVMPKIEEENERPVPPEIAAIPKNAKHVVYEVKPGDTVWRLAEIFNVSSASICSWNKLKKASIRVGQILSIYTVDKRQKTALKKPQPSAKPVRKSDQPTDRYIVRRGDNLYRIARRFSMGLDELYTLNGINPAKPNIHPGDILHVFSADKTNNSGYTNEHQKLQSGMVAYVVASGDNLFRIAQNFSVSVNDLRRANNLSSNALIRTGDTLFIPMNQKVYHTTASAHDRKMVYYEVKNGDNLWQIANNFGITVNQLITMNNLHLNKVLMPGDTLKVHVEGEM